MATIGGKAKGDNKKSVKVSPLAETSHSMLSSKSRKGGGSKLTRSETVTVRLDPKLRYLAELAARKHRRTLSSFIEWALEQQTNEVNLVRDDDLNVRTILSASDELWDVDEPDRFAKLAMNYPELLTHQEQVLWKLIRDITSLWLGCDRSKLESLHLRRLREHWDKLKGVASGELPDSSLDPLRRLPLLNEFGEEVKNHEWPS
jgi:hypothetical protein